MLPECREEWEGGAVKHHFKGEAFKIVQKKSSCTEVQELLEKEATSYSPGCYSSTICAGGLNDSVRNGKR